MTNYLECITINKFPMIMYHHYIYIKSKGNTSARTKNNKILSGIRNHKKFIFSLDNKSLEKVLSFKSLNFSTFPIKNYTSIDTNRYTIIDARKSFYYNKPTLIDLIIILNKIIIKISEDLNNYVNLVLKEKNRWPKEKQKLSHIINSSDSKMINLKDNYLVNKTSNQHEIRDLYSKIFDFQYECYTKKFSGNFKKITLKNISPTINYYDEDIMSLIVLITWVYEDILNKIINLIDSGFGHAI